MVKENIGTATSAEDLASSQENIPAVGVFVALRLVLPVELRLEQAKDPGGNIDKFILIVVRASF